MRFLYETWAEQISLVMEQSTVFQSLNIDLGQHTRYPEGPWALLAGSTDLGLSNLCDEIQKPRASNHIFGS